MSLPKYTSYQASGVPWLGEMPAHWRLCRYKQVFDERDERSERGHETLLSVSAYTGVSPRSEIIEEGDYLSRADSFEGYKVCYPDDLVMNIMLAWNRGLGFSTRNGIVSPAYAVFVPRPGNDPRFLDYMVRSDRVNLYYKAFSSGVIDSRLRLYPDTFGSLYCVLPTLSEQLSIAAFLDRETAKIDALIAAQQRLTSLLVEKRQATIAHAVTRGLNPNVRMTDSGVAWLGEVPAHWKIVRLGALFREVQDSGWQGLPVLSVSIHDGVSDRELDDSEMERKVTRSDDRSKYKEVRPGDLTYNMMRAWQGGLGTVNVHGMVSPAYVVARPIGDFDTSYVELLLRTQRAVSEMKRNSRGITDFRLRLYWDEFKVIQIAMPPQSEQLEISIFVCSESAKVDALAAEAQRNIALLQERRTALIAATVTGQLDVRNVSARSPGRTSHLKTIDVEKHTVNCGVT